MVVTIILRAVRTTGEEIDETLVGYAQYDSALRVVNRHNEVGLSGT